MEENYDDSASNPEAEAHLPVGGEVDPMNGIIAPDISDDMIAGVDEEKRVAS